MLVTGLKLNLEEILLLVEDLTLQEKAQLLKQLLGNLSSSKGMAIAFVNEATPEQLGEMLRAIANRVAAGTV